MAEKKVAKKASAGAKKKASPAASAKKKAASAKKTLTAQSSPRKSSPKKISPKKTETAASRDKRTKNPEGGLTEAGRKYFKQKEGANLKQGVKGPADTSEKKMRKGSFLRRHFANPRGPMERDGEPTRLALSAQAWGEPLPKKETDAKKLAGKGKKLLEEYKQGKEK